MKTIAIILARGGSKGIHKKNIINFCEKPLVAWTIENCINADINTVYVSSDSQEILAISENYGARSIKRPKNLADDKSSSESGWLHALNIIEKEIGNIDWVLAPQVTSPLRTADDIRKGIELANTGDYDSLFSCSIAEDLYFWELRENKMSSINYDWRNRNRRQNFPKQYIENGSFYFFRPEILRQYNNRLGSRIGLVSMEFWKMFEIDSIDDVRMCSALMREFII